MERDGAGEEKGYEKSGRPETGGRGKMGIGRRIREEEEEFSGELGGEMGKIYVRILT